MQQEKGLFEIQKKGNNFFCLTHIKESKWKEILLSNDITTTGDLKELKKFINLDRTDQNYLIDLNQFKPFLTQYANKITTHLNIFPQYEKDEIDIDPNLFVILSVKTTEDGEIISMTLKHSLVSMLSEADEPVTSNVLRSNQEQGSMKATSIDNNPDIKFVISQKNIEVDRLETRKASILNEIEVLEGNLAKCEYEDTDELTKKELENNKNQITELTESLKFHDENQKTLIEELQDAIDSNKDALYQKHKSIVLKINIINEEIKQLEKRNIYLVKKQSFDSSSAMINKLQIVINELKSELITIDKEIKKANFDSANIGKYSKIQAIKEIKNTIRNYQSKMVFSSQYSDVGYYFEITNITLIRNATSKYSSFYAVLFNLLNRGKIVNPSKYIRSQLLTQDYCGKVYQLQILFLSLIKEGYFGDLLWEISLKSEYQKIALIAFEDIVYWIQKLCELTKSTYEKPKLLFGESKNSIHIFFDETVAQPNSFSINISQSTDQEVPIWIERKIQYTIKPENSIHIDILNELLEYVFQFKKFKEGQIRIFANFLNGNSTIGILPTGGGKSLTYYFSVLLQPKTSLIIAPINSLIKDQTDKLRKLFGIDRMAILTGDNANKIDDMDSFKSGKILFTFASPERAQNIQFRNAMIKLSYNETIGSVILDEVHCLSEWGHDFRVPYLMLSETLNTFCENIHYLGLTATASVNVVKDLMIELSVDEKNVIYSKHLKRENLNFRIFTYFDAKSAKQALKDIVINNYGKGTIFDISKKNKEINSAIVFSQTVGGRDTGVTHLYNSLNALYPDEVGLYHGKDKDQQDAFMNDEKTILIATKAFGMGIDKPNIRMTLHFGMPGSREAFYQEAGRAGRDGKHANCWLYSFKPNPIIDRPKIMKFLDPQTPIQDLINIKNSLGHLDIGTNFHFYLESLEEPSQETSETLRIYNEIRNTNAKVYEINTKDKKTYEKYLYILYKLGIINNWNVRYITLENVNILAEINHNFDDIEHVKNSSLRYIDAYRKNEDVLQTQRDDKYKNEIIKVKSIHNLSVLIYQIRLWYHDIFVTTRREQLANMFKLVEDYANRSNSDEIQNVLEAYFDISESIGTTDEGYSLTFAENTLGEVIQFAFDLSEDKLIERQLALEFLLESVVSTKVDLYTGLINLRLNVFDNDRNGKQRFDYALLKLSDAEYKEVENQFIKLFQTLSTKNKLEILNSLILRKEDSLNRLYEVNQYDEILVGAICQKLNEKLNESW